MSGAIPSAGTRAEAAKQLADRYLPLWNEPDAERRWRMIADLRTRGGSQSSGRPIGLAATSEARGHSELEARAATSYWVGSEGLSFRAHDDAQRLGEVVTFHCEAVADDGSAAAVGLNVLVLAVDGRVQRNYTFMDGA